MVAKRQRGSKHDFPESALIVRDYATLKQIAQAFAAGQVKLLILLGAPGKGKGQIVRRAMQEQQPSSDEQFIQALNTTLNNILARLAPDAQPEQPAPNLGPGLYIKGYISPIKFHIDVYKHRDAPITIDDADDFFGNAQLRERTKHLTETDKFKLQAHSSLSKELIAQEVPKEFWTTSPVCIIRNVWDSADHINEAIESRGTIIVFQPTWVEAYQYIGSWYWDQEIFDYLLKMMPLLREPDVRIVTKAADLKRAAIPGLHWKSVIDQHIADASHRLMAEFLRKDDAQFGGKEKRIEAWIAEVKAQDPTATASRASWHRHKKEIDLFPRPDRIVLERNAPPEEFRPFDSPIGDESRSPEDLTLRH